MFGRRFFETISIIFAVFVLTVIFLAKPPARPLPQTNLQASGAALATSTPEARISPLASTTVSLATSTTLGPSHTQSVPASSTTAPLSVDAAPIIPQSTPDFEAINTSARSSVVNIFCTTPQAGGLEAVSGSGIIVSSGGIVLTNAHLAEYFLLPDFSITCTIRTGSPARNTYRAELLYLPLVWVEDNADVISSSTPIGTGEHDYAFLKITGAVDDSPLPTLPFMPIDMSQDMRDGDNMLLASYPASFLGGITLDENLYLASAIGQVSDLITFASTTIDMISVPGTVVSQKGSSGGAVVNAHGELVGLITTSSSASTTAGRDLRAITMSYIESDLKTQENLSLQRIFENPDQIKNDFTQNLAPVETKILVNAIEGQ